MAKPATPICALCERPMVSEKHGVYVLLMAGMPPIIYEVYHSDKFRCATCGNEVLSGYANDPSIVHFHEDADEQVARILALPRDAYVYVFESEEGKNVFHRNHFGLERSC